MSCLHFSIYPNILNIIDNVKFISIYDKSKTSSFDVGSEVSFFLGQPLFELDKKFNSIYIENLLLKIKADFYFPHPRENYSFKKIKIVDSNLIFEDYLLQYMEKNPSKKIILYSFFSTVLLNINHENVKKIAIYDDCLGERYKKIYEIMIDFNVILKPVEEIND